MWEKSAENLTQTTNIQLSKSSTNQLEHGSNTPRINWAWKTKTSTINQYQQLLNSQSQINHKWTQTSATKQIEQPVLLHQYKLNHCILSYEARATQKHKLTNIHKLRICTIPRKCKMWPCTRGTDATFTKNENTTSNKQTVK